MPRPRKQRILTHTLREAVYKPAGVPLDSLQIVTLCGEQVEAIGLADLEGRTQLEAASRMGISRSTFQRIVTEARRQVARALIEGHALRIESSSIEVTPPSPRGPRRPA